MLTVLYTALGVGGATVIGAIAGILIGKVSHKFSDIIMGFAAGIMLAAAVVGLIIPSLDNGNLLLTLLGIFSGAIVLTLIDKLTPHSHNVDGKMEQNFSKTVRKHNKVLLFVLAIAIHNFPEGVAAGVGFGTGDVANGVMISVGIALQNIPEGIIIIAPLLSTGISKKKTLLIASLTGLVEVIGTFVGYFAVSISVAILPFALAFAGGTMLYIISDEMIPETHSHGNHGGATYSIIIGFCVMLVLDFLI